MSDEDLHLSDGCVAIFSDMDTCMDTWIEDEEKMCAMKEVFGACLEKVGCGSENDVLCHVRHGFNCG